MTDRLTKAMGMPGIPSRRAVIGGLAAAAAAAAEARAAEPSLGELAARAGIRFGSALGGSGLADAAYVRLVLAQARILTTDPGFILPFVRPERTRTDYAPTDALAELAARNTIPLRGHCLIWNDVVPDWVKALSRSEVGRLLDAHVEETVGRYRGRMHSWDVVNEPFHPFERQPGGYRKGPWSDALGPAYIARALRRAAATDPAAKLAINEAWTEPETGPARAVRAGLLRLIDELQDAGVPLHAIGLQAHLDVTAPFDRDAFAGFLREIERRRLEIYITELDVNDLELDPNAAARDALVAAAYENFMTTVLGVGAVKAIITWQLSDRYSWLTNSYFVDKFPPRRRRFAARPLPFDASLAPKPAFAAIAEALRRRAL